MLESTLAAHVSKKNETNEESFSTKMDKFSC